MTLWDILVLRAEAGVVPGGLDGLADAGAVLGGGDDILLHLGLARVVRLLLLRGVDARLSHVHFRNAREHAHRAVRRLLLGGVEHLSDGACALDVLGGLQALESLHLDAVQGAVLRERTFRPDEFLLESVNVDISLAQCHFRFQHRLRLGAVRGLGAVSRSRVTHPPRLGKASVDRLLRKARMGHEHTGLLDRVFGRLQRVAQFVDRRLDRLAVLERIEDAEIPERLAGHRPGRAGSTAGGTASGTAGGGRSRERLGRAVEGGDRVEVPFEHLAGVCERLLRRLQLATRHPFRRHDTELLLLDDVRLLLETLQQLSGFVDGLHAGLRVAVLLAVPHRGGKHSTPAALGRLGRLEPRLHLRLLLDKHGKVHGGIAQAQLGIGDAARERLTLLAANELAHCLGVRLGDRLLGFRVVHLGADLADRRDRAARRLRGVRDLIDVGVAVAVRQGTLGGNPSQLGRDEQRRQVQPAAVLALGDLLGLDELYLVHVRNAEERRAGVARGRGPVGRQHRGGGFEQLVRHLADVLRELVRPSSDALDACHALGPRGAGGTRGAGHACRAAGHARCATGHARRARVDDDRLGHHRVSCRGELGGRRHVEPRVLRPLGLDEAEHPAGLARHLFEFDEQLGEAGLLGGETHRRELVLRLRDHFGGLAQLFLGDDHARRESLAETGLRHGVAASRASPGRPAPTRCGPARSHPRGPSSWKAPRQGPLGGRASTPRCRCRRGSRGRPSRWSERRGRR